MKKFLYLSFLIFLALHVGAQDFAPLTSASAKLFSHGQFADTTYSLKFDSLAVAGSDSVFIPHYLVSPDYYESDTCIAWGGGCFKQDSNTFIGESVISNNQGKYTFITNRKDSLVFDFNLAMGDSTVFFQNQDERFFMIYLGMDTSSIMGYNDSIKNYEIAHTDGNGNVINSALHHQPIRIGKTLGLTHFFRVDLFPVVLTPIHLIANKSPDLGMHALTYEKLYDHQPGDIIQYEKERYEEPGPPWGNYTIYTTKTYLERTDTPDSIIYTIARVQFNADSTEASYDTLRVAYNRNTVFRQIPYDYVSKENWNIQANTFRQVNACGLNLWENKMIIDYRIYCSPENSWCSYDIPGPPPWNWIIYRSGIGLWDDYENIYDIQYWQLYNRNRVVYFKKDGIECGELITVGLPEPVAKQAGIYVYPNPANDNLNIETAYPTKAQAQLMTMSGQTIRTFKLDERFTQISLADVLAGIYLLKVISGREIFIEKLIVE